MDQMYVVISASMGHEPSVLVFGNSLLLVLRELAHGDRVLIAFGMDGVTSKVRASCNKRSLSSER